MSNVIPMPRGIDETRRAVAGADRAFPVIEGGRGKRGRRPPADPADDPCPVVALGHLAGRYYFLDCIGQQVDLGARQLGNRHELVGLFGGNDAWLRKRFPKMVNVARIEHGVPVQDSDGKAVQDRVTVDFHINQAAKHLIGACFAAGLWGEWIQVRKPGVWPGEDGLPVVHCGDKVLAGGEWRDAGHRAGDVIWAAAAATARPGTSCDSSYGDALQADLQRLFRFRNPGGPIVVLGLLGTAYYGALAQWRAAGFLLGRAGCGKSTLLEVLAACCPVHWYSNDTTKAGLEQGLNGRAMPCFLDETEKSHDLRGAQALLDLVLTASGGRGTQGARGDLAGTGRRIEVVGSILMAATAPPEMRETHLGRFAMVHLEKPADGDDFREQHRALIERMKQRGPNLWGRALASWERYNAALATFRTALAGEGCAPREMDQLGAIAAGWWVLTHEGAPDGRGAREAVGALAGFVRTAEIVAEESNGRRLLQYLLSKSVMLDRSSAREPVGSLIMTVLQAYERRTDLATVDPCADGTPAGTARHALATHGIRVVSPLTPLDHKGRPAPCHSVDGGVWINHRCTELARLFDGSDWQASRWISGLAELDRVMRPSVVVRIGAMSVRNPIWVPLSELQIGSEEIQDTS